MNEVIFVGTSDAFGAGGRRQAALLVCGDDGNTLLDCAPTTVSGLRSLGVARETIDAIAISHFHADHFAGVPQFLLASHFEDGRSRPLVIGGPRGIEARIAHAARAMGHNMSRPLGYPVTYVEWDPGAETAVGPLSIETFKTHHQEETCPHGLIARSAGKTLVYSGDTGWFDGLPETVNDADLFICECTFFERDFEFHLNYQTLRERRDAFQCERMVITHLGEEMLPHRGQLEIETVDDGDRLRL